MKSNAFNQKINSPSSMSCGSWESCLVFFGLYISIRNSFMKVLIIEDNQDIASNIYDYLEVLGYMVDAAGDGVTGLHLAVTKTTM